MTGRTPSGTRSGHPLTAEAADDRLQAAMAANGDDPYADVPHPAEDHAAPGQSEQRRLTVVSLADFAAIDEQGAEALLGDGTDTLIPANGDVMVYGDGGAGKTTLCIDLACHSPPASTGWASPSPARSTCCWWRTKALDPCSA